MGGSERGSLFDEFSSNCASYGRGSQEIESGKLNQDEAQLVSLTLLILEMSQK